MSAVDLIELRDQVRRANAAQEPYDAADQWATLGGRMPDLLALVDRLTRERDEARDQARMFRRETETMAAEQVRLLRKLHGIRDLAVDMRAVGVALDDLREWAGRIDALLSPGVKS